MRRIFGICIAVFILCITGIQVQAATFNDIEGNSHAQAIEELVAQQLIKGHEDGTFRPNNAITRSNVVKLLGRFMRANGYMLPEHTLVEKRFEDVALNGDVELAQFAALLQEEGIFAGADGFLTPQATMERRHMAVVLVRFLKVMYDVDIVAMYKEAAFTSTLADLYKAGDNEKIEAITALEYAQITVVETFEPTSIVTRAQFASFLYRTMLYAKQYEHVQSEPVVSNDVSQATTIMIQDRAKLYSSHNMKHVVGLWRNPNTPVSFRIVNEAIVAVVVGRETYYVHAADVSSASAVVPSDDIPVIGAVRTTPYYRIIDADGALLVEGTRQTKLFVTAVTDNAYEISVGGQKGWIASTQTTLSSRMPLKVAIDTPYLNTALKPVGQLSKGFTFTQSGTVHNYVKIASKDGVYHVARTALVEGEAPNSLIAPSTGRFTTKIVAQHDAAAMTSGGAKIGTIAKGQVYELLHITDKMGIVSFAGGAAYVQLSDFLHMNQVVPTKAISYDEMVHHLQVFALLYPEFTELVPFGQSTEGRTLYALRVGNGQRHILMDASLHAREHMTTNVLLEMIDAYSYAYVNNQSYRGYDVRQLLDATAIWFVPMVNPDGVTLVQGGLAAAKDQTAILKLNEQNRNVSRWKANIRGVDLNRNFDGGWTQKETAAAPLYKNFKGYSMFSEAESQALRHFIEAHRFTSYISWHASGQIIYWSHNQAAAEAKRDRALAQRIANVTGYSLVPPQKGCCSGASTDWFIQTYRLPALTMEIAPYAGEGPVPLHRWADVWKRNDTVGLVAATEANSR